MIQLFGGGTINYVRAHFALAAPAYGQTARKLQHLFAEKGLPSQLHLTRMADQSSRMETNDQVAERLDAVLALPETRVVIFNVALCDFTGETDGLPSGKYAPRLQSRQGKQIVRLTPAEKLLPKVKNQRPDVILVGFKTTADAQFGQQLSLAHRQLVETGADMVFANDTSNRMNALVLRGAEHDPVFSFDRSLLLLTLASEVGRRLA